MNFSFQKAPEDKIISEETMKAIQELKLRYFTPQEIATLLCFPQNFSELMNIRNMFHEAMRFNKCLFKKWKDFDQLSTYTPV